MFSFPKHPTERTFFVVWFALVVLIAMQVGAFVWYILPRLEPEVVFRSLLHAVEQPVSAADVHESASRDLPSNPAAGQTMQGRGEVMSNVAVQRANALLEEAYRLRQQGNLSAALGVLLQASQLVPNEPGILFEMALLYEQAGQTQDALDLVRRVLALPLTQQSAAYAEIRRRANAKLEVLSGAGTYVSGGMASTKSSIQSGGLESGGGSELVSLMLAGQPVIRDGGGVPVGSRFGIVNCRLLESPPGHKTLRLAVQLSPLQSIDTAGIKIRVFFFEKLESGEIVQTASKLLAEWISPPTDWKEDEPEILDVKYPLPDSSTEENGNATYYGYVVGVYYQGALQDSRAEPVQLLEQFPLKLTWQEEKL